eukprot:1557398-Amphidinium_carterae.1
MLGRSGLTYATEGLATSTVLRAAPARQQSCNFRNHTATSSTPDCGRQPTQATYATSRLLSSTSITPSRHNTALIILPRCASPPKQNKAIKCTPRLGYDINSFTSTPMLEKTTRYTAPSSLLINSQPVIAPLESSTHNG